MTGYASGLEDAARVCDEEARSWRVLAAGVLVTHHRAEYENRAECYEETASAIRSLVPVAPTETQNTDRDKP